MLSQNIQLSAASIQSVSGAFPGIAVTDVLRLDLLHPVISGNKWFKLKYYLQKANANKQTTLLTFGGAYSNHIVATAAAANAAGFKSIGVIRGEEGATLSPSLHVASNFGMQLYFISREDYRDKQVPPIVFTNLPAEELLVIPEGGYGIDGARGAADILQSFDTTNYTQIITAVGTGTTLAGLIAAALPHQQVVGIPVLKNAFSLQQAIQQLLPQHLHSRINLQWNYHFGGYAKHTPPLLEFMNEFYSITGVPTDFVYTAKAFYAAQEMAKQNSFPPDSKLLLIHTGGLQGNASLKKGTLIYP